MYLARANRANTAHGYAMALRRHKLQLRRGPTGHTGPTDRPDDVGMARVVLVAQAHEAARCTATNQVAMRNPINVRLSCTALFALGHAKPMARSDRA